MHVDDHIHSRVLGHLQCAVEPLEGIGLHLPLLVGQQKRFKRQADEVEVEAFDQLKVAPSYVAGAIVLHQLIGLGVAKAIGKRADDRLLTPGISHRCIHGSSKSQFPRLQPLTRVWLARLDFDDGRALTGESW